MQNPKRSQPGTAPSNPPAKSGTTTPPQTDSTLGAQAPDDSSGGSPESAKPTTAQRMAYMLEHGVPMPKDGKPPAAGAAQGEANTEGTPAKPKKFNDLAGLLEGVELDELYALEIADGADGKPVTVQALKDHFAKRSEFSVAQLQWEEERKRQNAALVRGNAELRELLAAIPRDKLDKGVLEKVQAKVAENAKRERARTLEVIPEWKDKELAEKELAGISEWLQDFGYPSDYLATVYDHRALLMMRTAWMREQRVRAVLEEVEKESTSPPGGRSRPNGKAPSKPSSGARPKGRAGLMSLLE